MKILIAVPIVICVIAFLTNYNNCNTLKDFETSITKVDVSLIKTKHMQSLCDYCVTRFVDHNSDLYRRIMFKRSCHEWHEKYNPYHNYTKDPAICKDFIGYDYEGPEYRICAMFSRPCNKTICHYGFIYKNSTTITNTYDTYDDGDCPVYNNILQYKWYDKVFYVSTDGKQLSKYAYIDKLAILKSRCTNYWR